MMRLNQLCACDMENFGDVLYPMLLRHLVHRSVEEAAVEPYAFLPGESALGSGFRVQALRKLFLPGAAPVPLVIGGGDILRTDNEVLASHCLSRLPPPPEPFKFSARRGSWHLTYSIDPHPKEADPIRAFTKKWMPPVHGPYMLSPRNCPGTSGVAYFSAGVPFGFQREEHPQIQAVFEESSFVYLRDEQSAEKLRDAGVQRDLAVAPDAAVVISDLFPKKSLRDTASRLLGRIGLSTDQPYLCFQASAAATEKIDTIASQLRMFSQRHSMPIVLLPLGFCHGDRELLAKLAAAIPDGTKLAEPRTVMDMLAVLSHANLFAGVSMHGNISAYSYGIPHLFGSLNVDKIGGAMRAMELDTVQRITDWQELLPGIESILELDRATLADKRKRAATRVYEVADRMTASLEV